MKKILFTLAAMTVLSVAFASPALAAPRSGQTSHSSAYSRVSSSSYRGTSYSRSNYSGRVSSTSYRGCPPSRCSPNRPQRALGGNDVVAIK